MNYFSQNILFSAPEGLETNWWVYYNVAGGYIYNSFILFKTTFRVLLEVYLHSSVPGQWVVPCEGSMPQIPEKNDPPHDIRVRW